MEIKQESLASEMNNIIIDRETVGAYRKVHDFRIGVGFEKGVERFKRELPNIYKDVVQFVNPENGETVKGPKYDTTEQKVKGNDVHNLLHQGVKQQPPYEPMTHEPRDRFQENSNMNELNKFRNIIDECIKETRMKKDPRYRIKESLRNVVKEVLNEIAANIPHDLTEEEKTAIQKGYYKKGNERLDKDNDKLASELETIVHGIDPKWEVYWDDDRQLIVRAQNLLYVRITQRFENNYDIDAMVKLVDRVRAISLTWEQVKKFVKANFGDLKNKTIPDQKRQMSIDNHEDREVIKKDAGPEKAKVEPRYISPDKPKVKDTKKDDKDYNEPMTKRAEDMPDQPMKQTADVGKDPESKNKNIKKTEKVKPPKHKNDKKLRVSDKKTSKFSLKQIKP